MENQHRKITGYRELSQSEIDLMNRIKALGPEIETVLHEVRQHLDEQQDLARLSGDDPALDRLHDSTPFKWLVDASIGFQKSLMSLTRAVAQPTFF